MVGEALLSRVKAALEQRIQRKAHWNVISWARPLVWPARLTGTVVTTPFCNGYSPSWLERCYMYVQVQLRAGSINLFLPGRILITLYRPEWLGIEQLILIRTNSSQEFYFNSNVSALIQVPSSGNGRSDKNQGRYKCERHSKGEVESVIQ